MSILKLFLSISFLFFLPLTSTVSLVEDTDVPITQSSGWIYYSYTANKIPGTLYILAEGKSAQDTTRMYISVDCSSSCTLSSNPGQGGSYCYSTSALRSNLFEFTARTTCNLVIGLNIYQYSLGFVLKTRYYQNNYLTNMTQIFINSLNMQVNTNSFTFHRYFQFKADLNKNPGSLYLTLEGQTIYDKAGIYLTGDCFSCGLDYFPTTSSSSSCYSVAADQNNLLSVNLNGNCNITIMINVVSYQSGFNLKALYYPIIPLQNNTSYMIDSLNSSVSYNHWRYFSFRMPVPGTSYVMLEAQTNVESGQIYVSNDCGCYYVSNFPNSGSSSCQSTSLLQNNLVTYSFDYSCNLMIGAKVNAIRTYVIMKVLFLTNVMLRNDVPIDVGFVSQNYKYSGFYLYFSYLNQLVGANSIYIMLEGKSVADQARLFISKNDSLISNCKFDNFPDSSGYCWSTSVSQNNLFQLLELRSKELTTIGLYVSQINLGYTIRVKALPVLNLTNSTTISVEPITSFYYSSYIVYYNYLIPKNFPISTWYIFLKGLSSIDKAKMIFNYDCVSSCTYRDFPTESTNCYSTTTVNQFSFDWEKVTTSCQIYVGVVVTGLNSGFTLTTNHYPQIFLGNRQNYLINSIDPSYNNRDYYRTFYYTISSKDGPGILTFSLKGLSSNDYGSLYVSSLSICNYYYDFPSSSYYCSYASSVKQITTLSFNFSSAINDIFSVSVYVSNYYVGLSFTITYNQICLSSLSASCQECETDGKKSYCTKCKSGYLLDGSNDCRPCNSYQGLFYDSTLDKCNFCMDNCQTCSNISSCNQCSIGYIYDSSANLCVCSLQNLTNCKSCFVNGTTPTCTVCDNGFYLSSNSQCVNISQDSNFNLTQKIISNLDHISISWTRADSANSSIYFSIQANNFKNNHIFIQNGCNSRYPLISAVAYLSNSTGFYVDLSLPDLIKCGFSSSNNISYTGLVIYYNADLNIGHSTVLNVTIKSDNLMASYQLLEGSATKDGFGLSFTQVGSANSIVDQKIVSQGEQIQIQWTGNSNVNYYYSVQGSNTFNNHFLIMNTCNSKYMSISFIKFNQDANSTIITVTLSFADLLNCGFKNVNNGNSWDGIIVFYNSDQNEAYYKQLSIKVSVSTEGKQILTAIDDISNQNITVISNVLEEKSLGLAARIYFYSTSDYTNSVAATFNQSKSYLFLKLLSDVANYSISLSKVSLSSDYNLYDGGYMNLTVLKRENNGVYFSLDFSGVVTGTYTLSVNFEAILVQNNLRLLASSENFSNKFYFAQNDRFLGESNNLTNYTAVWLTINGEKTVKTSANFVEALKFNILWMILAALLFSVV